MRSRVPYYCLSCLWYRGNIVTCFFLFILKLYNDPFTITTIGSFVYAIEPMHYTSCPVKTNAYVNM